MLGYLSLILIINNYLISTRLPAKSSLSMLSLLRAIFDEYLLQWDDNTNKRNRGEPEKGESTEVIDILLPVTL